MTDLIANGESGASVRAKLNELVRLGSYIVVEDTPLLTGVSAYGVDGYGCIGWILDEDGEQTLTRLNATTGAVGEFQADNAMLPLLSHTVGEDDVYAETWEDGYGITAMRVRKADGVVEIGAAEISKLNAELESSDPTASMTDIDRVLSSSDGQSRIAQWTYIPVYGESTSVGSGGYPALSTVQPYANLTFTGGTKSAVGSDTAASKPLVEDNKNAGGGADTTTHGETPATAMASAISEYALQRHGILPSDLVIFSSTPGQGSQKISDLDKAGTYYTRLLGHVTAAMGLATAAGKTFTCPAVAFICGANDAANGTARATWLALMLQLAIDIDADIRAITGQSLPVKTFLYQTSGASATAAQLADIQLAQMDAIAQSPLIEGTGPWYDKAFNGDGVHNLNTGYNEGGRQIGLCIGRYLFEGEPRHFRVVAAFARGNTLRVRFSEPAKIDALTIGEATDYGLKVTDGTGTLSLFGIRIDAGDIVCTLHRALGASPVLRVALDAKGAGLTNGANGKSSNVRAVSTTAYSRAGVAREVIRWAPHSEIPIQILES